MSDDLVERVARALLKLRVGDDAWDDFRERSKPYYRSQARAALASIEAAGYVVVPREPTQEMIVAGVGDMNTNAGRARVVISWRNMLDAALEKDKANVG